MSHFDNWGGGLTEASSGEMINSIVSLSNPIELGRPSILEWSCQSWDEVKEHDVRILMSPNELADSTLQCIY